jgi:hypothetical protein
MKLLYNLIERYRRYRIKERSKRLAWTHDGTYEDMERRRLEIAYKIRSYEEYVYTYFGQPEETRPPLFGSEAEKLSYYNCSDYITIKKRYAMDNVSLNREPTRNIGELRRTLSRAQNDSDSLISRGQQAIADIERLRGRAVIAYLTAIDMDKYDHSLLNKTDLSALKQIIDGIPPCARKLDFIIHSLGGQLQIGRDVIDALRNRFDEIDFLIPRYAHSTAAFMTMAADNIIMDHLSSLSPFDPQIENPSGGFLSIHVTKITAVCALIGGFIPFFNRLNFPGWTSNIGIAKYIEAKWSLINHRRLAALWLTKYMFGHSGVKIGGKLGAPLLLNEKSVKNNPQQQDDYKKAWHIANYFTNYKFHCLQHGSHLSYNTLRDDGLIELGLNVSQADKELGDLMHEAYLIGEVIFESCPIAKIWLTSDQDVTFAATAKKEKEINDK